MGDFNAHSGGLQGVLPDDTVWTNESHPYSLNHRFTRDCLVDARGKILFSLTADFDLRALNGRTKGDSVGNFTWNRSNQKSTIDYVFTDNTVQADLRIVSDMAAVSDHAALYVTIYSNSAPDSDYLLPQPITAPSQPNIVLTEDARQSLPTIPLPALQALHHKWITNAPTSSPDQLLQSFEMALFQDISPHLIIPPPSKRCTHLLNPTRLLTRINPWYDRECILTARQLHCIRRNSGSHSMTYRTAYNHFRSILRRKRNAFIASLEHCCISHPTAFWRLLRMPTPPCAVAPSDM